MHNKLTTIIVGINNGNNMKSKKKIMVLGASYLQSFIIAKIKEMGHQAIALDGNPNCDSKDLADRFYACNTTDKEAVLEIAKKENIDGIMTYASDVAAPVVSFVAEHLNLPTNPFESVDIMTDKEKTRSFMEANGFNVPSHSQATCVEEAIHAAERIGYPVFIKPVDSNGSKGASRVNSTEEVRKSFEYAVNNSRSSRVIVEKFIVRKGYQVDAYCFMYNGILEFFYPMDQHQDPIAPYSPIGISAPSVLDEKKSQIAKDEVQRFLSLLNMRFGEFNVEYVFDENDDIYIIEIGPRSGGNLIPGVILESAGIDLRELNIRATLGEDISDFPFEKYTFKQNVTSHIFHSQIDGVFKGVEYDASVKDAVIFSKLFVKPGDKVHRFTSGVYALGFCLLKFDDNVLMNKVLDNSKDYIRVLVS